MRLRDRQQRENRNYFGVWNLRGYRVGCGCHSRPWHGRGRTPGYRATNLSYRWLKLMYLSLS